MQPYQVVLVYSRGNEEEALPPSTFGLALRQIVVPSIYTTCTTDLRVLYEVMKVKVCRNRVSTLEQLYSIYMT